MPFLELLFALIVMGILVAISLYLFAWLAGILAIIAFLLLLLGWIPILMTASDPDIIMGEQGVGAVAYIALWIYTLASLGIVGLMVFKPDPDGLPPAWKVLAMFYPTPARFKEGGMIDMEGLAQSSRETTKGMFGGSKFMKRTRARANAAKAENLRASAEDQAAQAELHRAAEAFNKAKMRAQEAKKRRKK